MLSLELFLSLSADLPLRLSSSGDLLLRSMFGDLDLLLEDRNLSCLGDKDLDLDLNLLGGSRRSLGPSLLLNLRSRGGEERNLFLSSYDGGRVSGYFSYSLMGVVESASILGSVCSSSALAGSESSLVSSLTGVAFAYSLVSTTLKSISTKLFVSDCKNTSICWIIESCR